ncbi:MAG: class I SAM-dependent rRNA methyltransferase [Candidatus Omnitrophica bacterium]|nr:class I SAM-dependent rRNA methyltransferase [Candidatus Omnitrophota bacterium]
MPSPVAVILKPGKEKPVLARHPWIFSGAIKHIEGNFGAGDLADIHAHDGKFLGRGYVNTQSQITVRILTFEEEPIDGAFFKKRIGQAMDFRRDWIRPDTNAYRMLHSEGDFLPGLVVDRYADFLIVELLTAGIDRLGALIVKTLQDLLHPKGIFQKDESDMRRLEGLTQRQAVLAGEVPPKPLEIQEHGLKFFVDVHGGQKTGFFLDQRENRFHLMRHVQGKRVLNCFGYTGAFSVYAAKGGAQNVVTVDSSRAALDMAGENLKLNGFDSPDFPCVQEDVFEFLRSNQDTFDVIILDPPAFAPTRNAVMQAARGYKDINRLAFKRLQPGGLLFTYSCSHHIDALLFQKILFSAACDANVNAQILEKTSNPWDHPVNIYHPEGEYLKGFVMVRE